ncbi:SA1362 family protein [Cytobacillus sp. S13-E01]|uniref:SA1362 family protein n=1 Tax=Cytobacillus sp. S13-E01 TaxID=3031326 RepID=UPI0023D7E7A2|nr:SA1362 family protein [Cytobacillus sp. S13-E01]MDF0727325.1 SA1362 family protein [Cytobacillus sp. S13-E01]
MNRRGTNIVIPILIVLGAIGILSTLIMEPGQLLKRLGFIALFAVLFFLIYKMYLRRRTGGKEQSAYLRAAKQSAKRFNEQGHKKSQIIGTVNKRANLTSVKKPTQANGQKKKKAISSHLTVIEGKKGKKKNRAFF